MKTLALILLVITLMAFTGCGDAVLAPDVDDNPVGTVDLGDDLGGGDDGEDFVDDMETDRHIPDDVHQP